MARGAGAGVVVKTTGSSVTVMDSEGGVSERETETERIGENNMNKKGDP